MKYYVIAGEKSGDLHAANLVNAIKQEDPEAVFRGIGGDKMKAAGTDIRIHFKEMAYMGFIEVLLHLRAIFGFLKSCKKDIDHWQPDVVVLVDFSGFNMKVAKHAKKQGFNVYYYISPKIWAWNRRRAYTIKKLIDRMFVILPFETDFYKRYGYDVDYVGNPVNDAVAAFEADPEFKQKYGLSDQPILTIMPGSRKQEVQKMLPKMLEVASGYNKDFQLVIATVDTLQEEVYKPIIARYPDIKVILDDTYNLLSYSHTAVVKSGTSTLETGLFRVPQVVCYKMGWLNYIVAELIVKVKYISLVNIIAGKEVVKELLQLKFTKAKLQKELKALLYDEQHRQEILDGYTEIQTTLGEPGTAIKTAKLMVGYLKSSN